MLVVLLLAFVHITFSDQTVDNTEYTAGTSHGFGYITCDPNCFTSYTTGSGGTIAPTSKKADVYHTVLYGEYYHPEAAYRVGASYNTGWAGAGNCVIYDASGLWGNNMYDYNNGVWLPQVYVVYQATGNSPNGGISFTSGTCRYQQGQTNFLNANLVFSTVRWMSGGASGSSVSGTAIRSWYDAYHHNSGHRITNNEWFRVQSYCYNSNIPEPPANAMPKGHWASQANSCCTWPDCTTCLSTWVGTYCHWSPLVVDGVNAGSGYWTGGQQTMYAYQGSNPSFSYTFTENLNDWVYLWHLTTCAAYGGSQVYGRAGASTTITFSANAYTNALVGVGYKICMSRSGYSAAGYVDTLFTVDIMDIVQLQGRTTTGVTVLMYGGGSCTLNSATTINGLSYHQLKVSTSTTCSNAMAGTAVTGLASFTLTANTCGSPHGDLAICFSRIPYTIFTNDFPYDTYWRLRTVKVTAIHGVSAGSAIHWYKGYGFGVAPAPAYFQITGSSNLDSTTNCFGLALKALGSCPAVAANANEKMASYNRAASPYQIVLSNGLLSTVGKYHFCASVDAGFSSCCPGIGTPDATYIYATSVEFWVVEVLTLDGYNWQAPYTWTRYISDVKTSTLTGNFLNGITPAPLIRFHTTCSVDCATTECTSMTLNTATLTFSYTQTQTRIKRLNLRLCINLPTMAPASSPVLYHDVGMRLQIIPTPTHTATPTHSQTSDNTLEVTMSLSLTDEFSSSMTHSLSDSITDEWSTTKTTTNDLTLSSTHSITDTLTDDYTVSGSITQDLSLTMSMTDDMSSTESLPVTATVSLSSDPTDDPSLTFSHSLTDTFTADSTLTLSLTDELSRTMTNTLSIERTLSMTTTRTITKTSDLSLTMTQTDDPSSTESLPVTATVTLSDDPTEDPTLSMTHTLTESISEQITQSLSLSLSRSDTISADISSTMSQTLDQSATESLPTTKTITLTLERTEDPTLSMSRSLTETYTAEQTLSGTITDELTKTETHSITPDMTLSMSLSLTGTGTKEHTLTLSQTLEKSATESLPTTKTITLTLERTEDPTLSMSRSLTETYTAEQTLSGTITDE
eukprot:PhF_6_TR11680/c0_g1_i2/m.18924